MHAGGGVLVEYSVMDVQTCVCAVSLLRRDGYLVFASTGCTTSAGCCARALYPVC